MDRAVSASLKRIAPVVVGPIAGFVALVFAPHRADGEFFSTSAQIVPVLLLGLILEARLFGSPRRAFHHAGAARIERGRRRLEFATLTVLLAAETQALWMLRDARNDGDPRLTVVGLAWGFASVATIAFYGIGRPRVEADLSIVERDSDRVVVQVGMSNVLGDRSVRPLVNVLFNLGAQVFHLDATLGNKTNLSHGLTTSVKVRDETVECFYTSARIELTPGDATVMRYELPMTDGDRVLVVVRLDSVEFEDGRIERGAFIHGGQHASLDDFDEPTVG